MPPVRSHFCPEQAYAENIIAAAGREEMNRMQKEDEYSESRDFPLDFVIAPMKKYLSKGGRERKKKSQDRPPEIHDLLRSDQPLS
jgi:hypothetical protein